MSNISINLDSVILAFLRAMPTPTDEHLHTFSGLIGLSYQQVETRIFELFSAVVEELEDPLMEATEEDFDDLGWDDLDLFLISFFLQFDSPSEEQFHRLSELIEVEPEELEERVYALLAELAATTEDTDEDVDVDVDVELDELEQMAFEEPSEEDRIVLTIPQNFDSDLNPSVDKIDLDVVMSRLIDSL